MTVQNPQLSSGQGYVAHVRHTTDPGQPPHRHIIACYNEAAHRPEVNLDLSQGGWEAEPEI